MEDSFWERKGVKGAFLWIALDIIALALFLIDGFSWDLIKERWLLLFVVIANLDRIVCPLANLPEPPGLFTFFIGLVPMGMLIAFFVSLKEADAEAQQKLAAVFFIVLLLWSAANIGWGIWKKKKSS